MSSRTDRINNLQQTLNTYVTNEQKRLSNEAQSLSAILQARPGGKGVTAVVVKVVKDVADNDLQAFLGVTGTS